jgi:dipeptidyl-peptidase 4
VEGVTQDEARRLARQRRYDMNPARTGTLLTMRGDLYYYEFGAPRAVRLTSSPEAEEEEVTFSPDGRRIAFVRDNDLFVLDIEAGQERALTTDGSENLLNGKLDWVYQEELYGRGRFRGYWWSPDSLHLAYLQLDQTPVARFPVVDHIPYRPEVEHQPYPKAGDPNPIARLGIVSAQGGGTRWVDLRKYEGVDLLLSNVGWAGDGRRVLFQAQDREQTWLDLNAADRASGAVTTLFQETTPAWIERTENPIWLRDGSFLWLTERSGWKHIYHYRADGTLIRQVTEGRWEARDLHGVDETGGWIYFSGTERSPIGLHVYRIRLDGTGLERLSSRAGTHRATFNPSFTRFISTWSDASTPSQVRLFRSDGHEVRIIDPNPVPALAEYQISTPEFLQVATRDGFVMEAVMIKPPDFDPTRRYPVYQHTYAGPHAQRVRNAWDGTRFLYHQLIAQQGIIVWICDNRTASGKGVESAWPVYRNFGELELRDIEDCLSWLTQQPYVDASRIGIEGWSYGGYMASYALTHSRNFVMGIAGGSVTDWRSYDTIYTERYMRTPQNNPEGYRRSSPRFAAADLHGALLLMHGTMDDNVHLQQTLQFAYELQRAGKPFQLMLYPRSRHGLTDPHLIKHLRSMMLDFTLQHLKPEATRPRPTSARE